MTIIKVPRPPKSAFQPDRPVSALLKNQVIHLQKAEFRLPASLQSDIYINAIKTEREAAEYIGRVTAALHEAHANARAAKARPGAKGKRGLEIAAVADDQVPRKRKAVRKKKARTKSRRKS